MILERSVRGSNHAERYIVTVAQNGEKGCRCMGDQAKAER